MLVLKSSYVEAFLSAPFGSIQPAVFSEDAFAPTRDRNDATIPITDPLSFRSIPWASFFPVLFRKTTSGLRSRFDAIGDDFLLLARL